MLLHKLLPLAMLVVAVSSFCAKDPIKEAAEEGKIAVVMLLKGSWPYCQSQAAKLYRWYSLLQDFQEDFEIILVNLKYNQHMSILQAITFNRFSYYQDTESRNIWGGFDVNGGEGGKKDDVFFFDVDGNMTYISTSSGSNDMGAADATCSDKDKIPVIKTLFQLISDKNADVTATSSPMCDDTMSLDFNTIFKRRPGMNKHKHKSNKNKKKDKQRKKSEKKQAKKEARKIKKEQRKLNKQKKKETRNADNTSPIKKNKRRRRKIKKH